MTLKYYESMCNCLSLGPKTFAAWQKWQLSQWSRDFCLKKNVFDKLPRSNADIYWWRRGFHWLSRQRERRENREGQRLSMRPLLSTSQQSEQKVFDELNYQQNMYKQDYFRKKTIIAIKQANISKSTLIFCRKNKLVSHGLWNDKLF